MNGYRWRPRAKEIRGPIETVGFQRAFASSGAARFPCDRAEVPAAMKQPQIQIKMAVGVGKRSDEMLTYESAGKPDPGSTATAGRDHHDRLSSFSTELNW
jgi:hypothetical protein